jgi:hypothetical protein
MAIVIGASTNAGIGGGDYCIISANWGFNPGSQRLYCLGSWEPHETYYRPSETLNLTLYAPGPTYGVTPTEDCVDADTINAYVDPAACGDTFLGLSGNWWVTGYSFSKDDAAMPGQESWSLTRWKNLSYPDPDAQTTAYPTHVMRGISEGQGTLNAGLRFAAGTTIVSSQTGNVSAGGFGRADTLYIGVIDQVGGGSSTPGETGQGSATLNYTQLYI